MSDMKEKIREERVIDGNPNIPNCPTAEQLVIDINKHSMINRHCPTCGEDIACVGLQDLVYDFGVCDCDIAPYSHLIERIYHRGCYLKDKCAHE